MLSSEEESIFLEYYKSEYHALLLYARKTLKNKFLAEEAVQELFTLAWQKRKLFVTSTACWMAIYFA